MVANDSAEWVKESLRTLRALLGDPSRLKAFAEKALNRKGRQETRKVREGEERHVA